LTRYTDAPVLALSFALLLVGSPEARFELHWQAPQECPDAAHVNARIGELLASSPSAGPILQADAQVERVDGRYEVELSLHTDADPLGVRTLADADCNELAEGVALIVALAVDPELLAGPSEDAGETGIAGQGESQTRELDHREEQHVAADPPDAKVEDIEDPIEPAPQPRPPLHMGAYALAGAGLIALPGATARLDVGLLATGDHWRIELGLSSWLPRRIADARYQAWSVELAGCGVPRIGIVEFPLCARIEAGAMIGQSLRPEGRRAVAPWLVATPGVGVIVRPEPTRGMLGVSVRADAVLPLTRPAFATDEGSLLVRVGFGAQILAGLELRLPASGHVRKRTRRPEQSVLDPARRGHTEPMPRRSAE
jgi:hypothetical protein